MSAGTTGTLHPQPAGGARMPAPALLAYIGLDAAGIGLFATLQYWGRGQWQSMELSFAVTASSPSGSGVQLSYQCVGNWMPWQADVCAPTSVQNAGCNPV